MLQKLISLVSYVAGNYQQILILFYHVIGAACALLGALIALLLPFPWVQPTNALQAALNWLKKYDKNPPSSS